MGKINWWMVAALTLAVVVVFLVGASLLPGDWGYASESGRDTTHWGMMSDGGNWWPWGPLFMVLMPLFMLLMPLLLLALLILGIIWLARAVFSPRDQGPDRPVSVPTCAECGQSVQIDWQICPYCGHSLS